MVCILLGKGLEMEFEDSSKNPSCDKVDASQKSKISLRIRRRLGEDSCAVGQPVPTAGSIKGERKLKLSTFSLAFHRLCVTLHMG